MGRGPGRVERAIEAAFTASPDATFSVAELGPVAYPGLTQVERRHRVAILRAADKIAAQLWWARLTSALPGGQIIYCNTLNVRSYAIGRLRADPLINTMTIAQIEALIEEPAPDDPWRGRSKWHLVRPGGAWWRHVEIARARKAGNTAEAERLHADLLADVARRSAALRGKL